MRIAIIGGGIAGLSAAYELEQARKLGTPVEYQLFESSLTLGGVISSTIAGGTVIERGPDSFLTEKPAAAELCRELGLADALLPSDDAHRKTFILVRNRLVPLPDGMMFLVPTKLLATALTPLFSLTTKLRIAMELMYPPGHRSRPRPNQDGDESVASLVRRHYGQQVVDRLADPLLSGIYGGDSSALSVRSVLPRLAAMEAQHGSLTRGVLASQRTALQIEPDSKRAIFTTLHGGLQQLIDALVTHLTPSRIHVKSPVSAIEKTPTGWRLAFPNTGPNTGPNLAARQIRHFDAVIVATPAWAAGDLLHPVDADLSHELSSIEYSSSITVNLVYNEQELAPLPAGFGFLVPAAEGRAILACTFIHRKFPGRTAPGKAVLRVFLGGTRNAALLAESDQHLASLVRHDLQQILGIAATPELTEVRRWPRAMAQYAVGHSARLKRIQTRLAAFPTLRLIGNAYDGIGISDCIRLGRNAARELAASTTQPGSKLPAVPATLQSHT